MQGLGFRVYGLGFRISVWELGVRVFPNAQQKGSRFKVGVQGSRRRREVVAFVSAIVRNRSQASAIVRNCSQASAIVRKRPQSFAVRRTCRRRKSSRNAELSSLFTFRVSKVSTVTGIGGVVVAKRRTVVTFGLVSGLRVSKVSTVTEIGGVVVAQHKTVGTFGLASGERGKQKEERRKER